MFKFYFHHFYSACLRTCCNCKPYVLVYTLEKASQSRIKLVTNNLGTRLNYLIFLSEPYLQCSRIKILVSWLCLFEQSVSVSTKWGNLWWYGLIWWSCIRWGWARLCQPGNSPTESTNPQFWGKQIISGQQGAVILSIFEKIENLNIGKGSK